MRYIFLSFVLIGCIKSKEDVGREKLLIGTWFNTEAIEKGFVENKTVYLPDGLVNWFAVIKTSETNFPPLVGYGTWYIRKGFLYCTMEKSNVSYFVPDGFTSADQIISLTSNQFVHIRSQDSRKIIEHRISKENSLELIEN